MPDGTLHSWQQETRLRRQSQLTKRECRLKNSPENSFLIRQTFHYYSAMNLLANSKLPRMRVCKGTSTHKSWNFSIKLKLRKINTKKETKFFLANSINRRRTLRYFGSNNDSGSIIDYVMCINITN